jgi:hypothetical protein
MVGRSQCERRANLSTAGTALALFFLFAGVAHAKQPTDRLAPLVPIEQRTIRHHRFVGIPLVPVEVDGQVEYVFPRRWRYFYDRNLFYPPSFYRDAEDYFCATDIITLDEACQLGGLPW